MTSRPQSQPRPPGPRGSWPVGNLAAYETDRLGFLLRLRDEYGDVVRFGPRTTVLNGPAAVAAALRRREDFAIEENFLQRRLTTDEQDDVASLRTTLSPTLRPAGLEQAPPIIERHLARALDRLGAGWQDPVPVLETAIAGAVAEVYFGEDGRGLPDLLAELLDQLSLVIGNPFALPERWETPVRRRIANQHAHLRDHVTRLLSARRGAEHGAESRPGVAAGVMRRAGDRYPVGRVADMVIGSLLASQRVPAAAGAWLLMALADAPRVQEGLAGRSPRAREEEAARIVVEVLRLYPPTWLLVRTATRPVEIDGYPFPAGHHFMISPYVLHRDAGAYPDPTAFRPDRWRHHRPPPAAYLPFGAGVHVCPGRHLASRILTMLALQVAAGYRVVRQEGPVTANPRTTLLPDGLRVVVRRAAERSGQLSA